MEGEVESSPSAKFVCQRVHTTLKPVSGLSDRCPFRFSIWWSPSEQRWFIPNKQFGCSSHLGHLQLPTQFCNARAGDLSQDERQLNKDVAQSDTKFSSHERLLQKRNEFALSTGKLKYLREQAKGLSINDVVTCNVGVDPVNIKGMKNPSPADKLLAEFDNNPEISYIALIAEFDSGLLTIKKKRKKKGEHSFEDVEDSLKDNCGGASTQAKLMKFSDRAMRIRKGLQVGPDEDNVILLAFAWTDNNSHLRFEMFGELTVADACHSTNKEERPLLVFSGIDSHNKTHAHTWIYLPAESRWVFRWAFKDALMALHGPRVLKRMRVLITDQDGQLMLAISDLIRDDNTWLNDANLVYRNCAWHKFDRNLTDHKDFKSLIADLDEDASLEWDALVSWLWMLVRRPETVYETNLLFILLELYLQQDDLLPHKLKRRFIDFITKLQNEQHKFAEHNFVDVRHFDKNTSNIGEAEISALKKHGYGPAPQDGLDQASVKIYSRSDQRHRIRMTGAAKNMSSQRSNEEDRDNSVPQLTSYSSNFLFKQFFVSPCFDRYRLSSRICYVRFRRDERQPLEKGKLIVHAPVFIPASAHTTVSQKPTK